MNHQHAQSLSGRSLLEAIASNSDLSTLHNANLDGCGLTAFPTGVGDAASDIGSLLNIYGESFVKRIQKSYPDLEKYLPRARFYAQSIELEWVLLGLETGEAFWFTAHLGGARDIRS